VAGLERISKMKYQDFIPPILARSLKKLFVSRTETTPQKFFLTYAEAREFCRSAGYEDADLVEMVFEKTKLVKDQLLNGKFPLSESAAQSLLAVLFALQQGGSQKEIKIMDFGGACGAHYFQLRPFIPRDVRLDWVVVETPAMVEKARAFQTDELCFVASVFEAREKLQNVNLLHSSGALQYVPDPQATIQEFMVCQPTYIFLSRLALSASETIITVQESLLSANGPGALPNRLQDQLCRYPVTYFPKHRLKGMLSPGYGVIMEFADTKMRVSEKEIFMNTNIFAEKVQ